MYRILTSFVCAFALLLAGDLAAQTITIGAAVTVSGIDGGWHPWFEMHIDPENPANIIICGTKANAQDNALYGFVYFSNNGGKSWNKVLEDRGSTWVTEQSCAYGVHGIAYFVSDSSKVIDGELHHELGTTRIYVSGDAGKTWKVGITTGWTDASTSVVDTRPGRDQNRLYTFFNGIWSFYTSLAEMEAAKAEDHVTGSEYGAANKHNRGGMISYRVGDLHIAGPFSSVEMANQRDRGVSPTSALQLNNGRILAFFTERRRNGKGDLEYSVEVARTSMDRSIIERPIRIWDSSPDRNEGDEWRCGNFPDTGATYDAVHDKLYFVYPDFHDRVCHLYLTTSSDGGESWSRAQPITYPDETPASEYFGLTIAINRDGVLGAMWQLKRRSGCWVFGISTDGGASLSRAERFGRCSKEQSKPNALSSAYLLASIFRTDPAQPSSSIKLILRNTQNDVWRDGGGIKVTPDGIFHAVWIDAANGEGEIRAVAIRVKPADAFVTAATNGLNDITNKVAILYGGKQFFDGKSKTLTFDVVVKNSSPNPITGPFKLTVPSLSYDYGCVEIANAENGVAGAGAVWDISRSIPSGTLDPGASSKPFRLKFRYLVNSDAPRESEDILGLNVRVFATDSLKGMGKR